MGVISRIFGGNKRNARLAAWGKTVPVSDSQRDAMRNIWAAVQSKSPPGDHPLEKLNDSDLAYIMRICASDFRPPEFGNADVLRLASWRYFKDLGFSKSEAAVAVGMMFNSVGRNDT